MPELVTQILSFIIIKLSIINKKSFKTIAFVWRSPLLYFIQTRCISVGIVYNFFTPYLALLFLMFSWVTVPSVIFLLLGYRYQGPGSPGKLFLNSQGLLELNLLFFLPPLGTSNKPFSFFCFLG